MSPFGWIRQLAEICDALRTLPSHLADAQNNDGRSIRDRVQEIEAGVQGDDGADQRTQHFERSRSADGVGDVVIGKVGEVAGRSEDHDGRPGRDPGVQVRSFPPKEDAYVAALVGAVDRLTETVRLQCRDLDLRGADVHNSHESSFQVAESEVGASDVPATILAGTPDTVLLSGDGASVEGPATTTGPSTSNILTIPVWTFGDRLRKARRRRGMDQRSLAELLGVSHATLGMWEKDANLPRNMLGVALELQRLLRVPAAWLLDADRP